MSLVDAQLDAHHMHPVTEQPESDSIVVPTVTRLAFGTRVKNDRQVLELRSVLAFSVSAVCLHISK